MMRANMVDLVMSPDGMAYRAADNAEAFVSVLESSHVRRLVDAAQWVAQEFADDTHAGIAAKDCDGSSGDGPKNWMSRPPVTSEVQ